MRELGVKEQPRHLLRNVTGLALKEMATPEVCCGFGGTFCVKYPEISDKMVSDKAADIAATGADTLLVRRSGLPPQHGGQAVAPWQARSASATSPKCWPA